MRDKDGERPGSKEMGESGKGKRNIESGVSQ